MSAKKSRGRKRAMKAASAAKSNASLSPEQQESLAAAQEDPLMKKVTTDDEFEPFRQFVESKDEDSETNPDLVRRMYLHCKRIRATWIPFGVAFIVGAFGVSALFMLLPSIGGESADILAKILDRLIGLESHELIDVEFSGEHILAPLSLVFCITIGVFALSRAHEDLKELMEAYPHIYFTYTAEEIRESRRQRHISMVWGFVFGGIGLALSLIFGFLGFRELTLGAMFCFAGVSAAFFVRAALVIKGIDIFVYNYDALKHQNLYELIKEENGPDRALLLTIKHTQMETSRINRFLIILGVFLTAILYFIPPVPRLVVWVPFAAAFIVNFIINHARLRTTRQYYSEKFSENQASELEKSLLD